MTLCIYIICSLTAYLVGAGVFFALLEHYDSGFRDHPADAWGVCAVWPILAPLTALFMLFGYLPYYATKSLLTRFKICPKLPKARARRAAERERL